MHQSNYFQCFHAEIPYKGIFSQLGNTTSSMQVTRQFSNELLTVVWRWSDQQLGRNVVTGFQVLEAVSPALNVIKAMYWSRCLNFAIYQSGTSLIFWFFTIDQLIQIFKSVCCIVRKEATFLSWKNVIGIHRGLALLNKGLIVTTLPSKCNVEHEYEHIEHEYKIPGV